METTPKPTSVNISEFRKPEGELEAKYGLPPEVRFCRRCVMSNQMPNSAIEYRHSKESRKATIQLDDDGVCEACKVADAKTEIDWTERERELRELCDRFRREDGRYDCIVPGSGGKDSFFASHLLKHEFGMHPLTVTWAPHIYTDWGWKNFESWIHAGFDNILLSPNGRVHRLLTRLALENLFHPFQPFMLGQKSIAPKFSVMYEVPLVFYGESNAEYGNPRAEAASAQQNWAYFASDKTDQVLLGGTSVADLKAQFGLASNDIDAYLPADPERLRKTGTEVHYLGYYVRWHPQKSYYYASEHGGFQPSPERTPGTYSKYSSIDDKIDDFHYFTTFVKFGIGRATYDSAQEIRSGDITRDDGVALVRRYDGEFPERFADELYRYLSIPESEFPKAAQMFDQPLMDRVYFMALAEKFRSPHLWDFENTWALRHAVWHDGPAS